SWSPRPRTWTSSRVAASRASTTPSSSCGPTAAATERAMAALTDLPGARGELGTELVAALELARAAGREVMKLRGGELGVELKPGDEPVTVADKRASELIVAGLRAKFPADAVISEELALDRGALEAATRSRAWL